ncbi:MAG: Hcp1 family type VI secretion system effector [Rhodocyclales bacterium GT-UBC]|nr:MAG: Hcp1 family type VI secretion system effector [Rhodocyclales bacterium GT-UBC]
MNFGAFAISKQVDKASPKLFEACCTGKHLKEVSIEVCRAGGDKQKYLEIRMEQVIVFSYVQEGGGEFPHEGISPNAGKYKIIYTQRGAYPGRRFGEIPSKVGETDLIGQAYLFPSVRVFGKKYRASSAALS